MSNTLQYITLSSFLINLQLNTTITQLQVKFETKYNHTPFNSCTTNTQQLFNHFGGVFEPPTAAPKHKNIFKSYLNLKLLKILTLNHEN